MIETTSPDIAAVAGKLTEAQREAATWLYGPCQGKPQFRTHRGPLLGDPSHAALGALVRKGLAEKYGCGGLPISYRPTVSGLALRQHLLENGRG